jgi:hypothetical protein
MAEQSSTDRVGEVLALVDRKLAALPYTTLGGLPYVSREQMFAVVNDAAREAGVIEEYYAAAQAAGPTSRGEALSPLELARRNGDVPAFGTQEADR